MTRSDRDQSAQQRLVDEEVVDEEAVEDETVDQETVVAVLFGGPSAEASVSASSADGVHRALAKSFENTSLVEVGDDLIGDLLQLKPDVVFPVLHGPPGEDGTVQGLLEMMGLPYVGSGVKGSAVAMDKRIAKSVFVDAGLPVAPTVFLKRNVELDAAVEQVKEALGERVVIKPVGQGSALGVTPLPNGGDLEAPLETALGFGDGVLVEPYVLGREITVGVLDLFGRAPMALPVTEIRVADDEWYDFENRYAVGKSEHIIPASIDAACAEGLQAAALKAHEVLDLRDLSRADFILRDDGSFVLLEVNAMPGMTPTSLYPDACQHIGWSFERLTKALVVSAIARHA